MTLTEYQIKAMETRLPNADVDYMLFNLVGEVGEFMGKIAKAHRDGIDDYYRYQRDLKKELGDILWHVAGIAESFEWTLDEIAQENLDKLASRQQRGVLGGSGDNR